MFSVKPKCSSGDYSKCRLQYKVESEIIVKAPEVPPGLDINIKDVDNKHGFVMCEHCMHGWAFGSVGDDVNYIEQGYLGEDNHSHDEGCEI